MFARERERDRDAHTHRQLYREHWEKKKDMQIWKTNKKGERGRDGGNRDRYRRVRDKKMNISLGERENNL